MSLCLTEKGFIASSKSHTCSHQIQTHRAGAGAGIGNYTVTRQQMKQSMLIGLRGGREEKGERRGGELKEDI